MTNSKDFKTKVCAAMLIILALAEILSSGCVAPTAGRSIDARTLRMRNSRITHASDFGPFYEHVETSDGDSRTSIMPFISTSINVVSENAGTREILWPLYSSSFRKNHSRSRFATAYLTDFDTTDPNSRDSLWILPFWFSGKAKSGDKYAALFPLGGTIRDFTFYDRISFILWPLYTSFQQHDIEGKFILWPFFSSMRSDDTRKWRIFPFYMYAKKDGKYEQRSILWPFWNSAKYLEEPGTGYQWSLFPFCGHGDRSVEKSWFIIPPFFQYVRGYGPNDGYRRILAPWPLVRIEDSKTYCKRHFYPFYATTWTVNPHDSVLLPIASTITENKSDEHEPLISARKTHILWPFFERSTTTYGGYFHEQWSLVPILSRTLVIPEDNTGKSPIKSDVPSESLSYFRFWPFFSTNRQNKKFLFSFPDLNLQRRVGILERNFLRMFTIYTYGSDEPNGKKVHNLFWGMFRRGSSSNGYSEIRIWPIFTYKRNDEGSKPSWRILAGLIGRDVDIDGVYRNRYLWFFRGKSCKVQPMNASVGKEETKE